MDCCKTFTANGLAIVVLASTVLLVVVTTTNAESPSGADEIRQRQPRADVLFLSSEELRGRSVTDDTIVQAAEYVAARMKEIGLQTDLFDGTPMQAVEIPVGARLGAPEKNRISLMSPVASGSNKDRSGAGADESQPLSATLRSGMNPLAMGAIEGQFRGPIAFVGYGITAPKLGYDDYANVDVRGKAVIMLRKEPGNDDEQSVFDGKRNSRHAYFSTKITNAVAHQARAVIIVNDAASTKQDVLAKQEKLDQEIARRQKLHEQLDSLPEAASNSRESLQTQLTNVAGMIEAAEKELVAAQSGLLELIEAEVTDDKEKQTPVLAISRELASRILMKAVGQSIEEIEKQIDADVKPRSAAMDDWTVDLQMQLEPSIANTANIIGVLPGTGVLADESVIIGAHYDHVGMGGFGSLAPGTIAVHNGADDNASGTAVLLASASQLLDRVDGLSDCRRIIFIAFTGEERGLVGSLHYAKYPRFPLEKTVAMINLDMVGRLRDNELTLYGTGSGVGMNELVDRVNRRHRFDIFKVESGYGPSDHQSFYERGIPVLFFFTGLHNDYHRPTDDFDKIDFGGMARITDMVSDVALEFATGRNVPTYAKTKNEVKIRRQLTAYLGVSLAVKLNQVIVASVTPGAPGEQGGLQVGDALEMIGKTRINRTSDVLESLRQHEPGETVTIQLRRNHRTLSIPIKLAARPGSND